MLARDSNAKTAGALMLSVIIIGVLSISPEVDSTQYLTAAAQNVAKVTRSAVYQFGVAMAYIGIAVVIYPVVKDHGPKRALGYLCFTLVGAALICVGAVTLSSILLFSQELARGGVQDIALTNAIGYTLKMTRDYFNHGYMVLALCLGKFLLYALFYQSRLVPRAFSVIGMVAATVSAVASLLILFQRMDVVTPEYIALNTPTALHEIGLAIWLLSKGFSKPSAQV